LSYWEVLLADRTGITTLLTETLNINFLGLVVVIFLGILTILIPRRFAVLPFILVTCYVPIAGTKIDIASFNFSILRIIIFFGWIRLISKKEIFSIKLNVIDKAILLWVGAAVLIYTISRGSFPDFKNRLGLAYDFLGLYFYFRSVIDDEKVVETAIKICAIILFPLSIIMLFERITGFNVFSIFGGVEATTLYGDGRVRCSGPFRHPILAGTFGATLIPLFVGSWFSKRENRRISIIGISSAMVIVITAASSGPFLSLIIAIIGLLLWPLRNNMRIVRWGIFYILLFGHFLMKAPIWFIFARMGDFIGGDGWHRSYLIDQAITHFSEWWLSGTDYTREWFPYGVPYNSKMADITNQFISEGIQGGLLQLTLFVLIIILCYRKLGIAIQKSTNAEMWQLKRLWTLGCALLAHIISFLSVTYFDQTIVSWFLLIAIISFVTEGVPNRRSLKSCYD
jgi:hypothetical protein